MSIREHLLLVFISVNVGTVCSDDRDIFSSTWDLQRLLTRELEFSAGLESLAVTLEAQAKTIRDFIKKNYAGFEPGDPEKHVSHPLNSLALVKRTGSILRKSGVMEVLDSDEVKNKTKQLFDLTTTFPGEEDWMGGCNGVHLLQEYYNLNTSLMARGEIRMEDPTGKKFVSDVVMGPEELMQIGINAVNDRYYDTGVQWLQMSLEMAERRFKKKKEWPKELKYLRNHVKNAKQIHDHNLDNKGAIGSSWRCNKVPFDPKLRKKKKYKAALKEKSVKRVEKDHMLYPLYQEPEHKLKLRDNFNQMCKGVEFRVADMEVEVKCRLLHQNNPYLKLGPFKLEEKSKLPYITLLHEMMSDKEIEYFKNYASSKGLKRSQHANGDRGGDVKSLTRTSKQVWLPFQDFSPVSNLTEEQRYEVNRSKRQWRVDPEYIVENKNETLYGFHPSDEVAWGVAERFTLATTLVTWTPLSSEDFQIGNYGLGGLYSYHMDAHGAWDGATDNQRFVMTGDRISTMMVYLSDVEAGGATTFPSTGVRFEARKGTAGFWLNVRPSGKKDYLTYHGGCPVLVGNKWITNLWVGYSDQFLQWPCQREEQDRYGHFTKYY